MDSIDLHSPFWSVFRVKRFVISDFSMAKNSLSAVKSPVMNKHMIDFQRIVDNVTITFDHGQNSGN